MACATINTDDDFVTCGVCWSEYDTEERKPKFLQCSHTVCLQCLEQMCQKGFITCPFCRKTNAMDDISAVPNNSYALHMMKHKEKKEISKPIVNLLVVGWCLNCDSAENPNCISLGHSIIKLTDSIMRNIKAWDNLKREVVEKNEQKKDHLVKALEKRKQVQEKLSEILKSIKAVEERIETIQEDNDLQFNEIVSILERNFDGPNEKDKKDLSLSELINLVDDSSQDDAIETLSLKMAKSVELSEEKFNEATTLASEYDFEDKSKLVVQLIDAENRPIPWTGKWLGGLTSGRKLKNHVLCHFTKSQGQNEADVNKATGYGANAIHIVCGKYQKENLIEIIRLLIQNGVNVQEKSRTGWTALHLVCRYYESDNLMEIIQLLVESGVDVNAKEKELNGCTALHCVCAFYNKNNLSEIIQFLIENGASAKEKTKGHITALHLVCFYYGNENLIEVIRLLIRNGNEVNENDDSGWAALHYVCQSYRKDNLKEIIEVLIENGAEVNKKTNKGSTALDIVKKSSDYIKDKNEIMKLLGDQSSD